MLRRREVRGDRNRSVPRTRRQRLAGEAEVAVGFVVVVVAVEVEVEIVAVVGDDVAEEVSIPPRQGHDRSNRRRYRGHTHVRIPP